jgi:AP-3 complex subunit beta
MQIINLGAKLLLTNPDKTRELVHYVFFLAKFDTNYDIRDKARVLRFLLFPNKVRFL